MMPRFKVEIPNLIGRISGRVNFGKVQLSVESSIPMKIWNSDKIWVLEPLT